MAGFEIVRLGASALDDKTKLPRVQALGELATLDDEEAFGEIDCFGPLGLTSLPYPANANGHAEGLVARDVPGTDGVLVGARDARTAGIVGNLAPGDTVLHSTGPEQAAQVQCKEAKRQVVLATKSTDGKTALLVLDGQNDKAQIAAFGYMVEVSTDNGISLVDKTGKAGIQIKDGLVSIFGMVCLGGRNPPFVPLLGGAPPGAPIPGVFYGS